MKHIMLVAWGSIVIAGSVYLMPNQGRHEAMHTNKTVQFLYSSSLGKIFLFFLRQPFLNKAIGSYCNLSISTIHIPSFIKYYGIQMNESLYKDYEFTTFNEFFARPLIAGARPIDAHSLSVISPADGTIIALENIKPTDVFPIKKQFFNIAQFLRDKELANSYHEGTLLLFRLSPADYHRFHFPFDCTPSAASRIKGTLESVDPVVYSKVQPLHTNERQLIMLHNPFNQHPVIMMVIGALCVGKIFTTYQANKSYNKGDEAGYFHFGGSTIVLLFKKNTLLVNPLILHNSRLGIETPIKMGQKVGLFQGG